MKKFTVLFSVFIFSSIGVDRAIHAQDLSQTIQNLSQKSAQNYVRPAITGFNTNLNSGWFHRAPAPKWFGFHFEAGFVFMGTTFKKNQARTFSLSDSARLDSFQAAKLTSFVFDNSQFSSLSASQKSQIQQDLIKQVRGIPLIVNISGPTIIGSKKDSVKIVYTGSDSVTYTDPFNGSTTLDLGQYAKDVTLPVHGYHFKFGPVEDAVPLFAPQVTIGTLVGSQFTFRYFKSPMGEAGKFDYFGWGVQHNPAVWFGKFPIDMALSYFTQKLKQSHMNSHASAFGITASKQFGWSFLNLTPYAGFMKETSRTSFHYSFFIPQPVDPITNTAPADQEIKIAFKEKGKNDTRITLGMSMRFVLLNFNADYNFAKYNSFSFGVTAAI